MITDNLSINERGHLCFAGRDVTTLAAKYGTPLYIIDDAKILENCRLYVDAMHKYFGQDAMPLYAGKALCVKHIYDLIKNEDMGIDVVSCGEIYTAYIAGFNMSKAYFHGNNKTDEDVSYAMEKGVGYFVCDNIEELRAINRLAAANGLVQKVLLRLTPGIDPHTHKAISTGRVDSKFGAAIETGQAEELLRQSLDMLNVRVMGYHCHIGSQIFETKPFIDAATIMLRFAADMRDKMGYTAHELNLGGGMGVKYTKDQPNIDYAANISLIAQSMRSVLSELDMDMPAIRLEPGRSIVAAAGMTLYTVGTVKTIPGFKNYVSIDGGMPDNPRYALYQSPYTIEPANRMNDDRCKLYTVAGRCCESGDLIQEGVALPDTPERGDILAVLTTGAYNYSMASNYNRIPRPAMIALGKDYEKTVLRRETYEDLVSNDMD